VGHWPAVAIFLGLLASVAYGFADFIGGLMSRPNHVFTVLLWGQIIGIAWVLASLPLLAGGPPTADALLWGAGSGVAGIFGAAALFRGLATGRMSVVAPVTAVLAASLPVVFGLLTGERPGAVSLTGVVVALGAIALVSTVPKPGEERGGGAALRARLVAEGLPWAVASGLCFAAYFVQISLVPEESGIWPILGVRLSSLVVSGGFVLALGLRVRLAPRTTAGVLTGGLVGTAADYVFLLSSRLGLLSVVAVLTSLYPVTTVILARVVLKERMGWLQLAGLLLAGAGVVLITAG
jgi:drug/metabolite transporter (DMT)-like permease